jgi:hypothetical protein
MATFTHWVDWDVRGKLLVRALCGTLIRRRDHSKAPTCPTCQQLLAQRDGMQF